MMVGSRRAEFKVEGIVVLSTAAIRVHRAER